MMVWCHFHASLNAAGSLTSSTRLPRRATSPAKAAWHCTSASFHIGVLTKASVGGTGASCMAVSHSRGRASARVSGSFWSKPMNCSASRAASSTLRVMTPIWSSGRDCFSTPYLETKPKLGL